MTNGGRQRGTKLAEPVERAQAGEAGVDEPELAAAPQAISWIWMLPVTWLERGRKQASCRPGGSSRRATAGTSRNSQTWIAVPTASRSPARARPIGRLEGAEVGVEVVPLVADHHQLAGLVGGDQQRRAELPQQRREVRRVDGPQRRRVFRLGRLEIQRGFGGRNGCRHEFPRSAPRMGVIRWDLGQGADAPRSL